MTLFTRKFFLFFILVLGSISSKGVTANFTADYVTGCSPLVVHFTNTSTGATSYYWDLGNGTTSTLTNVSGSYITPGTYTVTLTATSASGSTSVRTLTITVYPSPVVSFYASDTGLCPGGSTTFTSTSTLGTSGAGTYLWNFGDGSSSTSPSPTHVYSSPGYYNVTLVVTNSMGCYTSLTLGAYIRVFTPPNAGFSASVTSFCNPPGNATFFNTSTGTASFTYAWTFGDGGTSTAASPTHTYASTGTYTVNMIVTDANGCMDTLTRTNYIVVRSTTTSFTYPSTACVGAAITFNNTSSTHTSSNWSFGDGGTSTADTATHVFGTSGTYTVRLIIFNGGCYDTTFNTIVILPAPTVSFSYAPTLPCPATATIVFSGSIPTGASVSWAFGDGTTATTVTGGTSHTYSSNGFDTVYMTVTDASGCRGVDSEVVRIYDLYANMGSTVTGGCVPLTVNFVANAETHIPAGFSAYPAAITSYHWDFGDGSGPSSSGTPAHTYTAVGVYHAVLTITTANGCTATDTIDISVGTVPVITVTDTPSHVCYNHAHHYNVTVISGGPIDNIFWNFNDGTTITDTFLTMAHTFTYPGVDSVYVIAYNNGCPSAPFWIRNSITDSPKAIIETRFICSGTGVTFYDSSMGDDTHLWMFGDGTTSTADSILHTYASATSYVCTLATYNAASGCRDTQMIPIHLAPPTLNVTASDSVLCEGAIISFTPVTDTNTVHWWWYDKRSPATSWTFWYGDDSSTVFSDTFRVSGLYSIKLEILDTRGCYDTFVRTNWIKIAKPVDSFVTTTASGCWPLPVTFTDHSYDITGFYVTNYNWSFGDGGTATVTSPTVSHTYTAAGTFSVTEIVTDNIGCRDTLVRTNLITVWRPHASASVSNNYPCLGTSVHFTNLSSGAASVFWMFGDGDTSSVSSPNHTYTANGVYTVKIVAIDSHGCRDTATYTGVINVSGPDAAFTVSDSFTICPPITVHFYNGSTGATSYSWAFGDGGTSVMVSPSDLYTSSGYYTVRLVAFNSHGCTDTAYKHINVYGYAGAFTYSPLTGCSPLTVHFNAAISNVPTIIWDFADGTTSMASYTDSAVHTYTVPGAYVPKLILSDNTGCQNSSLGLDTIKVNAVRPGFTTIPHPVCVNTNINFLDTSFSYFSTITSWHWEFTAGDTSNLSSPPYFYNTIGSYPVRLFVTDGWGCTGSVIDTVHVYPPPVISASADTTICVGDSATLQGYGGTSYVWTPPATLGCPTCQSTPAYPVVETVYTVVGTDVHGCSSTDSVRVMMRTLTVSRGWGDTEVCRNVNVQLFDTGGTKYTWIPATGLSNPYIWNPIAAPPYSTRYMVIAQYGGCTPDTNYVTVLVHQLPTVDAGANQVLIAGSVAQLQATGTLIAHYLWTPSETLSCDSCSNPIASMMNTTIYTVTVSSSFGCKASDTVSVTLFCDQSQIFIPNTFTPNGDGENDVFYPRGKGVKHINSFKIFNRWGNLLYEKTNLDINDVSKAWDGSYGGSTPRPDVYVYFLDAICDTGEPIFIKGDVTLVK